MLARARERVRDPNVDLVLGDAATHALPHDAFDLTFSRFGVMFFDEPAAAFAHLRSGLRADGRITWVVWQRPDVNYWASVPLAAVRGLVEIPAPDPYAPGPFSLADPDHLTRLLSTAGYRDVALAGHELELAVGGGLPLADAVEFLLDHGPVFRVLGRAPADVRAAARDRLLDALAPYEKPSGVWFAAAVWVVTAHP
jgi:SAM-dependent methyltransferase